MENKNEQFNCQSFTLLIIFSLLSMHAYIKIAWVNWNWLCYKPIPALAFGFICSINMYLHRIDHTAPIQNSAEICNWGLFIVLAGVQSEAIPTRILPPIFLQKWAIRIVYGYSVSLKWSKTIQWHMLYCTLRMTVYDQFYQLSILQSLYQLELQLGIKPRGSKTM